MSTNFNLNRDVANAQGNVTMQVSKNGVITQEFSIHNAVTEEGIMCILNNLCNAYSNDIKGYKLTGTTQEIGTIHELTEEIQTDFVSRKIVTTEGGSYVEFKIFIPSDAYNGSVLTGVKLYTKDSTNTDIVFATVEANVDKDQNDINIIGSGGHNEIITKTQDVNVLYIWRIAITSIFLNAIN